MEQSQSLLGIIFLKEGFDLRGYAIFPDQQNGPQKAFVYE